MKELLQLRAAVIQALGEGGLTALEAFPAGRAKRYPGAVAAVSVGAAEGKTLGFCNYLGEQYDASSGQVWERYGKRLEAEILVDVRAETAADCEGGCAAASSVLLSGLPEGVRPGELRWEEVKWERESGFFLRRGRLQCSALFLAQSQEGEPVFLDFQLKGVLKHE